MAASHNNIVLYHYSFSPVAQRVVWYLALRKIDYAQCMQPSILPRPDLEAIGVKYRRIPVMAIGSDVYCDSRLILSTLERLFPHGALRSFQSDHEGVRKLLETWAVEGGLFARAVQLFPSTTTLFQDSSFQRDREEFTGRSFDAKDIDAARPGALVYIRDAFSTMETMLADGRDWILSTESPSLADIDGIWVFRSLAAVKGALPQDLISDSQYPRVFGWIQRFNQVVKTARSEAPRPTAVTGGEARKQILAANYAEPTVEVDSQDPLGLKAGQLVEVWPTDSGSQHRDRGRLVGLNQNEVVVILDETFPKRPIRLHFPRIAFGVRALDRPAANL